jgi:hypothetical protein
LWRRRVFDEEGCGGGRGGEEIGDETPPNENPHRRKPDSDK